MFTGEYQHTIDAKGRLAIPAKFRGRLERGAVLVRGAEPCLYMFTVEEWERIGEALERAEIDKERRRRMDRRFFGTAFECELDAQGRIVVPPKFRTFAGLDGETTIIGARKRCEIWNSARWEAYQDEMANDDLTGLDLPF